MEAVIERVNRTSALWQEFGFLCDLIVIGTDGDARYYEEMPVDYVHESDFGANENYFTVTLEYGPGHDQFDPFDVSVGRISQTDYEHSDKGRYLHPVVRRYRRSTLEAEHHVTENLENDWTWPAHRDPLQGFFSREIATAEIAPASLRAVR